MNVSRLFELNHNITPGYCEKYLNMECMLV